MSEYEKWLAGEIAWEDLGSATQERIDNEAMGLSIGDATRSDLLHKSVDEKRFTLGPWYIPNRLDAHDEWTDAEELQAGLWDYVRKGDRGIRLQHNRDIVAGEWVEAMQMPVEVTMQKQAGGEEITYPEGTVFLGVVWKPWAWELVKKGKIRGFSIGGSSSRVPIEPLNKAKNRPLTIVPAVIRIGKRSFAIRPEGEDVVVSNGRDRHVLSLDQLTDAMHKNERAVFEWEAEDREEFVKALRQGPFDDGFWFRTLDGWELSKQKFSSDSDRGRYAANIRWSKWAATQRAGLETKMQGLASQIKFGTDGLPEIGPLGLPKTAAGQKMASKMGSMVGHVDFDKVADEMQKNPDAFGVDDPSNLPDPPYNLIQKHMTPERLAIHQQIIESEMAGKKPVEGRPPEYVFLGGGGASGKSTILESGQASVPTRVLKDGRAELAHPRDAIEINSDDLKAKLPEYKALTEGGEIKTAMYPNGKPVINPSTGKPVTYDAGRSPDETARFKAASFVHEESSYLAKAINRRAMAMGLDIVLDGTSDGKVGAQMRRLQEIGATTPTIKGVPTPYKTRMIMVSVDTDTAVDRAFSRAQATGRLVPEGTLRSAHVGASRAFLETKDLYDSVEGYYTGTRPPTKFMEGTKRGEVKILEPTAYKQFVDKATETTDPKYKSYEDWLALEAERT